MAPAIRPAKNASPGGQLFPGLGHSARPPKAVSTRPSRFIRRKQHRARCPLHREALGTHASATWESNPPGPACRAGAVSSLLVARVVGVAGIEPA